MNGFLQYAEGNTIMHRLNPLTKLILSFFLCMSSFLSSSHIFLVGLICLNLLIAAAGGIAGHALRMLKGLVKLSILIFLLQLLFIRAGNPYPLPFGIVITDTGLNIATLVVLRLLGATMPLALMLSLTKMNDLSNVLVDRLHIPYRYAFALTTALRFIPIFAEEMQCIMEAQTSRGVEFDTKNIFKRLRLLLPLCVPLLIASVKKIESGAISAELRGFGLRDQNRKRKSLPLYAGDFCFSAASVLVLAVSLFI